jgi:hypothetical protein
VGDTAESLIGRLRTDHAQGQSLVISAPTMRIPRDVADTVNAYLAFRAALRAVLDHNAS